jgi:guanosine-3',5'-bis(diphosphate) 3'-pyrophosphohydrolase
LAIEAAKQHLRDLEQSQPTCQSGGQLGLGIQDRVFVVAPDGTRRRIFPEHDATGAAVTLLAAASFAAQKHSRQRRKDCDATPYINHPIAVAEVLARVGAVTDLTTLQAAILHDTLEDTETTPEELEKQFGQAVCLLVQELTDDKSLPQQERRRLQIEHAPHLSAAAKQIKVADKICNVSDITPTQPTDWPLRRKRDYLDWAEQVVAGCRGCSVLLERHFDYILNEKRQTLQTDV